MTEQLRLDSKRKYYFLQDMLLSVRSREQGVFVRGTRFVVGEDLAIAPVDDFS